MNVEHASDRQRVLETAILYLGEQYRGRLKIIDGLPEQDRGLMRIAGIMHDCWSLYVPDERFCVGSARIVCISKKTFRVIFDSRVGE